MGVEAALASCNRDEDSGGLALQPTDTRDRGRVGLSRQSAPATVRGYDVLAQREVVTEAGSDVAPTSRQRMSQPPRQSGHPRRDRGRHGTTSERQGLGGPTKHSIAWHMWRSRRTDGAIRRPRSLGTAASGHLGLKSRPSRGQMHQMPRSRSRPPSATLHSQPRSRLRRSDTAIREQPRSPGGDGLVRPLVAVASD